MMSPTPLVGLHSIQGPFKEITFIIVGGIIISYGSLLSYLPAFGKGIVLYLELSDLLEGGAL